MSTLRRSARELFVELIETCPQSDWSSRLDEVRRHDARLADRVASLLTAHVRPANLFEESVSLYTSRIDDVELEKTTIGPYLLREKIGEGGFGVVYVAEQIEPIRRKVALKLIKPGMDSREVIARFAAERQTLAMMDHPHVARVLDAGMTENGRPYFVMELVQGKRLTTFCDQAKLTIVERLRLFNDICRAVQHAHQKGIIHRDLKPSNILVAWHDATPVPKVIDFGVAKALTGQLTEQTVYTRFNQLIGTPMYMSPEQAQMGSVDIDTRTDVYSLGVILYRLLSGTTPFDRESLNKASPERLQQIIRECEPLRPSLRFSLLSEADQVAICAERQTDVRRLRSLLSGDLDWIVMMAIDKDRNRRYASPAALVEDIERFLAGQVVVARPPSSMYRLQKFVRQHRGVIATATIILLALLSGLAVALLQRNEAVKARALAEQRLLDVARHREHAEALLYVSDVRLAARSLREGDVRQAVELLQRHRPGPDETDRRGVEWHLLMRHAGGNTTTIVPSESPLYSVAISPSGERLVTAGADATVYVFDSRTLQLVTTFESGQGEVNSLRFTRDGTRLLTTGDDGTVRVWSFPDCILLHSIHCSDQIAFSAVLDPQEEFLFVCGRDAAIPVFSFPSGKRIGLLQAHERAVEALAISNDGRLLASASSDFRVVVWDVRTRAVKMAAEREDRLSAVAFLQKPSLLIDGCINGHLTLTNVHVGQTEAVLNMGIPIQSLAVSPDETAIVVGTRDGYLHLVEVIRRPNGGGYDLSTVTSWEAHGGRVYAVCWDGGDTVVSVARDGTLCRSRLPQNVRRGRVVPLPFVESVSLARDGRRLLWAGEDRMGGIDLLERKEIPLPGLPGDVPWKSVAWTPDDERFVAATDDGRAFLIPFDDPASARPFELQLQHGVYVDSVSRDGRRCALVALDDDEIKVVDLSSLKVLLSIHLADNRTAALSDDGTRLALNRGRDLLLFDVDSGRILFESRQHHAEVIQTVEFLPEGSDIVTTGRDQTIRIWNSATRTRPETVGIEGSGSPADVTIARNGRTAVSATTGGVISLWHLPTRQLLFPMAKLDTPYREILLSADEQLMLTVDARRVVRVYPLRQSWWHLLSPQDGP